MWRRKGGARLYIKLTFGWDKYKQARWSGGRSLLLLLGGRTRRTVRRSQKERDGMINRGNCRVAWWSTCHPGWTPLKREGSRDDAGGGVPAARSREREARAVMRARVSEHSLAASRTPSWSSLRRRRRERVQGRNEGSGLSPTLHLRATKSTRITRREVSSERRPVGSTLRDEGERARPVSSTVRTPRQAILSTSPTKRESNARSVGKARDQLVGRCCWMVFTRTA